MEPQLDPGILERLLPCYAESIEVALANGHTLRDALAIMGREIDGIADVKLRKGEMSNQHLAHDEP